MNRSGITRLFVQTCLAISLGLAFFAVTVTAADSTTNAAGLTAGFAEADITPAVGMEAPGGYGKSYHQIGARPVQDSCCRVRRRRASSGRGRH